MNLCDLLINVSLILIRSCVCLRPVLRPLSHILWQKWHILTPLCFILRKIIIILPELLPRPEHFTLKRGATKRGHNLIWNWKIWLNYSSLWTTHQGRDGNMLRGSVRLHWELPTCRGWAPRGKTPTRSSGKTTTSCINTSHRKTGSWPPPNQGINMTLAFVLCSIWGWMLLAFNCWER